VHKGKVTSRRFVGSLVAGLAVVSVAACGPATASGATPVVPAASPSSPAVQPTVPSSAPATAATPTVTPTPAASPTKVATTTKTVNMTFQGVARNYIVFAPAVTTPMTASSAALPMIVILHGLGATPLYEAERTDFAPLAGLDQAVVVYPAGVDQEWNVGNGCCARPKAAVPNVNDVAFVSAVVASVEATHAIDTTRVYLVGYSAGGKLASKIACAGGSPFVAVATYGAVPVTSCSSKGSKLPVLVADGTNDTALPYVGGPRRAPPIPSIASVVALWRTRDDCPQKSVTTSPGPAVTTQTWSCGGSTSVAEVLYPGASHLWPNGTDEPAYANGATVIWAWLATQH
jgi:polyhydroxybutyrate depolymerase